MGVVVNNWGRIFFPPKQLGKTTGEKSCPQLFLVGVVVPFVVMAIVVDSGSAGVGLSKRRTVS